MAQAVGELGKVALEVGEVEQGRRLVFSQRYQRRSWRLPLPLAERLGLEEGSAKGARTPPGVKN
jgi:hypothetical protein